MSNPRIEVDIEGLRFYLNQLAGGGLGYQIGEQIGAGIAKALGLPAPRKGPCELCGDGLKVYEYYGKHGPHSAPCPLCCPQESYRFWRMHEIARFENVRPDPPGGGSEVEFMDSVKHV